MGPFITMTKREMCEFISIEMACEIIEIYIDKIKNKPINWYNRMFNRIGFRVTIVNDDKFIIRPLI